MRFLHPFLLFFSYFSVFCSLSTFERDYAKNLGSAWLENGYKRAKELYNCSNMEVLSNQFVDPEFWGHFVSNPKLVCALKMLTNICNVDGMQSALIPNSKLCVGQLVEFFDDKYEKTRAKYRKPQYKKYADKLLKQGGYSVCMREDVLPRSFAEKEKRNCVVISVGSNNHWGFEKGAYNYTDCDIHTFEPRVVDNWHPKHTNEDIIRPPAEIENRTVNHWAMIQSNLKKETERNFDQSYPSVNRSLIKRNQRLDVIEPRGAPDIDFLEMLNASGVSAEKPLDILKVDCEGCEHQFFKKIFENNLTHHLPPIIVYEIHLGKIPSERDIKNIYELLASVHSLIKAGFIPYDNRVGDGGCELGMMRID